MRVASGRLLAALDPCEPETRLAQEAQRGYTRGVRQNHEESACDRWFGTRSEEHTAELQSHWYMSYAGFCLRTKEKENKSERVEIIQAKKRALGSVRPQ